MPNTHSPSFHYCCAKMPLEESERHPARGRSQQSLGYLGVDLSHSLLASSLVCCLIHSFAPLDLSSTLEYQRNASLGTLSVKTLFALRSSNNDSVAQATATTISTEVLSNTDICSASTDGRYSLRS